MRNRECNVFIYSCITMPTLHTQFVKTGSRASFHAAIAGLEGRLAENEVLIPEVTERPEPKGRGRLVGLAMLYMLLTMLAKMKLASPLARVPSPPLASPPAKWTISTIY